MAAFDPASFKAPFINFDEIRKQADDFRDMHWKTQIPVDIFHIIEFDLELEIRPLLGLKRTGDIDSFLLGDFSGIVVDEEEYMDDRYLNRIRYSVAHEIGHYVLHKNVYSKFEITDEGDWIELIQNIPENEYTWIEQQAYEFAGRLLVPLNEHKLCFQKYISEIKQIKQSLPGIEDIKIAERISPNICNKFEVSAGVISKRIMIEKLLENF